ncbi:uncharacterized protein BJ212DRAFT_764746 [Suillus subaureus]|uniref:Uncharacterized protein n=1 Tax=Suillus subaureus TaxID=48587 RepID=A0A9P7DZJ2_9AGAM|nr:uncharacterized protein BJ212DRAFT_764746 [Suillus subaureus]KAG1807097.1 hypothetical protein BJ212DRAFT_764746 [Suillus subaureus]
MLNTGLIQKLLKCLWRVLAALAQSSAQRLRVLVFCLRRCVAKVHALPGHSTDSKSSTADPCCAAGASNARCPQATLPLPLHHQITSTNTASGTQDVLSSSILPYAMPAPYVPKQIVPSHTSSPPGVGNAIPSNTSSITPPFVPFAANDVLRYENRPLVYVQLPHNSRWS